MDVLTVGLNSMDLLALVDPFPAPNSKHPLHSFTQRPGGQAASAAVALARLGLRTEYIGRYGDDAFGRDGLASLEPDGVHHARAIVVPGASSQFAIILVQRATGERTVLWHRHPGLALQAEDIPDPAVANARVVLVDCHETAAVTSVARRARRAGTRTVVDVERVRPGIMDLLREIDVVIAAEGFPEACTGGTSLGGALEKLQRETGAPVVCVTLGERGSLTRCGGEELYVPAFAGDVVDTTGLATCFGPASSRAGSSPTGRPTCQRCSGTRAPWLPEVSSAWRARGAPTRAEVSAFLSMQPSVRRHGPMT
jgi:sugar/nucleoside kinase (ribokinase family)